jgi:hypothetical protein
MGMETVMTRNFRLCFSVLALCGLTLGAGMVLQTPGAQAQGFQSLVRFGRKLFQPRSQGQLLVDFKPPQEALPGNREGGGTRGCLAE